MLAYRLNHEACLTTNTVYPAQYLERSSAIVRCVTWNVTHQSQTKEHCVQHHEIKLISQTKGETSREKRQMTVTYWMRDPAGLLPSEQIRMTKLVGTRVSDVIGTGLQINLQQANPSERGDQNVDTTTEAWLESNSPC